MSMEKIASELIQHTPLETNIHDRIDHEENPFSEILQKAFSHVTDSQKNTQNVIQDFTQGKEGDIHDVMINIAEADITLKFFVNMRNRCLEAYKEIMHMGS